MHCPKFVLCPCCSLGMNLFFMLFVACVCVLCMCTVCSNMCVYVCNVYMVFVFEDRCVHGYYINIYVCVCVSGGKCCSKKVGDKLTAEIEKHVGHYPHELPPNIYALSELAYRRLVHQKENQCIIISLRCFFSPSSIPLRLSSPHLPAHVRAHTVLVCSCHIPPP